MQTIGDAIKELMKINNLSQSDMAKRLNVTPAYIWKLINKPESRPSDRLINDICREFGVDDIWLKTGEGEMFQPATQEEELAEFLADIKRSSDSDPIKKIILAFMKLPKDKQELMKEIMQQMIENK